MFSWRSGEVEISVRRKPAGAIAMFRFDTLAAAGKAKLQLEAAARHGYDGDLLIPGVPEAEDDEAAYQAMLRFCGQMKVRFDRVLGPRGYQYLGAEHLLRASEAPLRRTQ